MISASTSNIRKKKRTDDKIAEKTADKRLPIAPLRAAENKINGAFGTLQSAFANHLRENAKKHILLLSKINNKQIQIKKMETPSTDKEFFPRSARFAFELSISKEGAETPDFINLKEECNQELLRTKQRFKMLIIRATKIEAAIMKKKLRKEFIIFSRNIARATALTINLDLDPDIIITTLMKDKDAILQTLGTTYDEFVAEFKTINKITSDIRPYSTANQRQNTATAQNTAVSPYFGTNPPTAGTTTQTIDPIKTKIDYVGNIIDQTYIEPWNIYKKTSSSNKLDLELKKIIETEIGENTNDITEMEIDGEGVMDAQTMNEIITKKTNAATTKLSTEIKHLKNQISQLKSSKNSTRGPSRGASAKKEITKAKKQVGQKATKRTNTGKKDTPQSTEGPPKKVTFQSNKRNDSVRRKGRSRSRSSRKK